MRYLFFLWALVLFFVSWCESICFIFVNLFDSGRENMSNPSLKKADIPQPYYLLVYAIWLDALPTAAAALGHGKPDAAQRLADLAVKLAGT